MRNKLYKLLLFFTGSKNETSERKKKRFITYFVLIVLANVLLGKNLSATRYPWYSNISVFLQLNINIFLILVGTIVIFRSLARVVADREKKIFGSKLQTRLVLFISILIFIPTFLTFFISVGIVNSGMDRWMSSHVLRTAYIGQEMSSEYYRFEEARLKKQLQNTETFIKTNKIQPYSDNMQNFVSMLIDLEFITGYNLYDNAEALLEDYIADNASIEKLITDGEATGIEHTKSPFLWVGKLITIEDTQFYLIFKSPLSLVMPALTNEISSLRLFFQEVRYFSHPIRKSFNTTLLLISLLIVFAGIWGSILFIRSITKPIKSLATAAGRISRGHFDTVVAVSGNDEISFLGRSFNYMAANMKKYMGDLEAKNSELTEALAIISQDKAFIDLIYKNVDSGMVLFSEEMNILKINAFAEEILFNNSGGMQQFAYNAIKEFIESSDVERFRQYNITIDGENRVIGSTMNKISTPSNMNTVMLVLDDNTYLLNIQRVDLWKEVATRITHEIKNPLTPIKLTAERVNRRLDKITDDKTREVIGDSMNTIITEVNDLARLVEEFSIYARTPSTVRSQFILLDMLEEVLSLYKGHANAEIVSNVDHSFMISGDRHQLKRMFSNLVQNAEQAAIDGGNIKIYVDKEDETVVVAIEDNGMGIKEEDLKNIFMPYFSKKPDGTGLGLAIVKKTIEEHNGSITAESVQDNFTRFTVKLPIATEHN